MESSETQHQVLNLGKKLVKEFSLEPGIDTLSRWIAHYIAEQISLSEKAIGKDKKEIDKRCFESILQLWAHHASYTGNRRPFESFQPIFNALYRLDPEGSNPYHRSLYGSQEKSSDELNASEKVVQDWVNVALNIDVITKLLVEFSLTQAIESAEEGKVEEWLRNADGLPGDDEVSIILSFISNESDRKGEQEKELDKLNDRLRKIDGFEAICNTLREAYKKRIDVLSKDQFVVSLCLLEIK